MDIHVALATCKVLPEPDPDEALLLDALARAGAKTRLLAWDDEDAPFHQQDLVVLRSTWNYYERVEDFLGWTARTSSQARLLNPAAVVAWNARKTYLLELEARGVAIVPSALVMRGATQGLADIMKERGWDDVVVKPLVSASSFRTERFSRATMTEGARFLEALVADRDAMVQRWMPAVETSGERSLVWIDGHVTHAIRKSPRLAGGIEHVTDVPVADDERAFAERALEPFARELLYARVDVIRDRDSDPARSLRIMELELIEPSLFFRQSPPALERFVRAIVRRS